MLLTEHLLLIYHPCRYYICTNNLITYLFVYVIFIRNRLHRNNKSLSLSLWRSSFIIFENLQLNIKNPVRHFLFQSSSQTNLNAFLESRNRRMCFMSLFVEALIVINASVVIGMHIMPLRFMYVFFFLIFLFCSNF